MNLDLNIDARALGKVAVLMGGSSAERQVSLTMSGPGVLAALRSMGVDAHAFDPSERALHELKAEGFARCFIALHGRDGEDGTVQGALSLLGIPYTGSGVLASALAMDKIMTKRLWLADGLPTPRWAALRPGDTRLPAGMSLPVYIKPPHEGSSIGASKVTDLAALPAAIELSARYDQVVLCEEFIDGPELTCPVLGEGDEAVALPVIEIRPKVAYDFESKYLTDSTEYLIGHLAPEMEAEIQQLVLRAYKSLGCRTWGRADVMLREGKPYLLEMNTSPGMTSHSLVPMSAKAAGISYEQLCLWLVSRARADA